MQEDSNTPVLEVSNLGVSFQSGGKTVQAVDDISFCLHHNEVLGIVGESGSGKSVTSLAIMQLLPKPAALIDQGKIMFYDGSANVDILAQSQRQMELIRGNRISMIFQEPMTSLNPVMRCGEQVAETLRKHKHLNNREAKEKTLQLFEEVRLPDPKRAWEAYPHQLSGGQKQRVMIASAISCDPAVLIADEPTTALDVTVQRSITDLLNRLREKYNMGIIFITHDLGVIADIAHQVVVMYKGRIVEKGTAAGIFSAPTHPYTQGLIACRPPIDFRYMKLPVVSDFLNKTENENSGIQTVFSQTNIEKPEERKQRHTEIYAAKPILEVKDLSVTYPDAGGLFKKKSVQHAVNDISFDVYYGETLGLVGESGCGKTTTGRAILRLIETSSGLIRYKDKELTKLSGSEIKHLRKNLQIIFQDPYSSLNPRQTVGSCLTEPMKVHGIGKNNAARKEIACDLLSQTGLLPEHFNRYPHEFSGGQRQRICVARALSLQPEFIICDESVSALDVSVQAQVLNLLNDLKRNYGFTYIFISHDLSVVRFMADRIIVMNKGKIEETGDPDLVFQKPESPYTQKLIDSLPGKKVIG
ncbi:MAG: ABC transporter ATP-binding protein [Bacteroidetes bacterium]|nr:ABC transporter ATP-binding protein [Bacteroidota bacterium]MBU1717898.1 ABC transporter ATP-binding protein [Bacteroidota bacterium]